MLATPAEMAWVSLGFASQITLPLEFFTRRINVGWTCLPWFARVPYAEAISSGDTPYVRPPMAMAGSAFRVLVMPMRLAMSTTRSGDHVQAQLRVDRVVAAEGGRGDAHGAAVRLAPVDLHLPGLGLARDLELQGLRRVVGVEGVYPHLHGGCQHEHLECGAGLAPALHGQVELGAVVVGSGHHGADVAGARLDGHQRGRGVALGVERGGDGLLRHLLVGRVDGGLHAQAALEDHVLAEHVDELLAHVGHHVGLLHLGVR